MTFFKEHYKNDFLEQFENEDTREVYKRIFKKSKKLEEKYNIDLFNFNKSQADELVKNYIMPETKQSARTYCNVISSYIQWAISNGISESKENPFKQTQEYYASFVENQSDLYLSKTEIDMIVRNLVNAQDSFIIQALFNGIHGKKVSELTLLTREQIKKAKENAKVTNNYILKLKDLDGNEREIRTDKDTIDLASMALEEDEYYKKNGEVDYSHNVREVIALPYSDYVLKPTITKKNTGDKAKPISHYTVYNRLEMIKSLNRFSDYKDALTSKNIVRSGMIYEAKKVLDRGIELDRIEIENICIKFGMTYKWSVRDFLNEKTVREVYS